MSRKLSVDSVSDSSDDDLLVALLFQAFRSPSLSGWLLNTAFAVIPASIAVLCWLDGYVLYTFLSVAVAFATIMLRVYLVRGEDDVDAESAPAPAQGSRRAALIRAGTGAEGHGGGRPGDLS